MIICNLNNVYDFYRCPNILAAIVCWNGLLCRLKYQPERLIQVTSPLPLSVTDKLMIVTWQVAGVLKSLCGIQVIKTGQQFLGSDPPKCLEKFSLIFT